MESKWNRQSLTKYKEMNCGVLFLDFIIALAQQLLLYGYSLFDKKVLNAGFVHMLAEKVWQRTPICAFTCLTLVTSTLFGWWCDVSFDPTLITTFAGVTFMYICMQMTHRWLYQRSLKLISRYKRLDVNNLSLINLQLNIFFYLWLWPSASTNPSNHFIYSANISSDV